MPLSPGGRISGVAFAVTAGRCCFVPPAAHLARCEVLHTRFRWPARIVAWRMMQWRGNGTRRGMDSETAAAARRLYRSLSGSRMVTPLLRFRVLTVDLTADTKLTPKLIRAGMGC